MRLLLLAFSLCLGIAPLLAQNTSLPFPRNFENSYQNGLRNWDGSPGPKYWQNRSDYKIQVSLDPKKQKVAGSEAVVYVNNSPDQLKMIRLKLIHDLYRKGAQRDDDVDPRDIHDGVKIKKLAIDDVAVSNDKSQNRHDSYLDIQLTQPLESGGSLKLSVDWEYQMPLSKHAARECVCDPGTFFIPYFYPEIAVYDDLHGWVSAPYTGTQEFYHDFSNYEVAITVPKGFQVWATGEWQNAADILTPAYLERWGKAHGSSEVLSIFSEAELKSGVVFQKAKNHTFRFTARDVPDFTFAVSNHYNWDALSVVVDDKTQRQTLVSAAYASDSEDFKQVARIAADGIRLMSTWLPGYPFPYPSLTVFNGNDGMEYPMMINDASVSKDFVTELTIHEASHMYFPFMMGINEQYYAWMDEGWANFFEYYISDSLEHTRSKLWGGGFGNDWEVPPMVPSRSLDGRAYGFAAYTRPQFAYNTLYDLLGYEKFRECMVVYMDRWKGKHPGPYDFFNTFNRVSGQNLDWFWKPWFFEFGYPDLKLTVSKKENLTGGAPEYVAYVERVGNIPVPLQLEMEYADGTKRQLHKSAEVWKDLSIRVLEIPISEAANPLVKVSLGREDIPDAKPKDNVWKAP